MARTTVTKTTAPGLYGTTGADVTLAAGDAVNGNQFVSTGKELIIAHNTDGAAAHTVTVQSTDDPKYARQGDAALSVGASEYAVMGPFPPHGWAQSDGYVYVDVDDAQVELGVITLP